MCKVTMERYGVPPTRLNEEPCRPAEAFIGLTVSDEAEDAMVHIVHRRFRLINFIIPKNRCIVYFQSHVIILTSLSAFRASILPKPTHKLHSRIYTVLCIVV